MKKRSKLRRRPDGRPEYRSVDDLLKEAAAQVNKADQGRPIDLSDYFSSGAENRIGNRLLKDNEVLPQPLQERKDAEELRRRAETYLQSETARLSCERERIGAAVQPVTAPFPDRATLLALLELDTWPHYLADPTGTPLPSLNLWLQQGVAAQQLITTYNRQIEIAQTQYLELLEKANACVARLNIQVAFSPHLAAQMQMPKDNTAQRRQVIHSQLPPLLPLPRDLDQRLARYYRSLKPNFWQRLTAPYRAS